MNIRNNVVKTYVESYYRKTERYVPSKYIGPFWNRVKDPNTGKYVSEDQYVPARYETTSHLEILDANGKWVKIPEVVTNVNIAEPCKGCN